MANKDYEQKRRYCWEEFNNDVGRCKDRPKICFFRAFDRAYALGKEKETITQEEIEKAAEDYVSFEKGGKCYPSYIVERACCCAFKDGANFALGKQEKDADTVLQGWVAKDNDIDGVYLYSSMPERGINMWNGHGSLLIHLDSDLFPDLTWDDEPQEIEIILKRKKK